ncbi:FtsX-like permease family protein [Hamadaea sp. NPDC051192]|uniref:FtsX-like permease family protein n=1 Tax=Hamadaea sp. NPDC051192 TaxID=3154940 RepID=UPI00342EEC15
MIRLLWDAVWGRRTQALTVGVLTALAVGTAAAAPWYVFASAEQLAARIVAEASTEQRMVHVNAYARTSDLPNGRVPAAKALKVIENATGDDHSTPITGLRLTGPILRPGASAKGALLAREGACEHAVVDGACPAGPGQILVSDGVARSLSLAVGDRFSMKIDNSSEVAELTVVGLYRPVRADDRYWSGVWDHDSRVIDPLLTAASTFDHLPTARPQTTVDLELGLGAYTPGLGNRLGALQSGEASWTLDWFSSAGEVPNIINSVQNEMSAGIVAATGRFVLLAWFALLVVVRQTVAARRTDLALVKLRGVRRWRVWTATMGQTVGVMLGGAVLGAAAGYAWVRAVIGPVVWPDDIDLALTQSAELFGGVLLAALALAWLSELRSLRSPVVELLRNVPPRVRGRAVDAAELVIVTLLAIGVWQLTTVEALRSGSVTATMVPALLAIAVGLLAARFVLWLSGRAGSAAMRAGRLTVAVAGLSARRRPTLRWVVTLLVVAIAGLTTAMGDMVRGEQAVTARAEQQLGADRVVQVDGVSRRNLLDAVRDIDPAGTRGMAVSYFSSSVGFAPGLLAVDTARLGAVADWLPEYGPVPKAPAAVDDPIRVADGALEITASFDRKAYALGDRTQQVKSPNPDFPPIDEPIAPPTEIIGDVFAQVALVSAAGAQTIVRFGPLQEGRHDYRASVSACAGGCRLVWLGLAAARDGSNQADLLWGTRVNLHAVRQEGRELLDAATLGERLKWTGSSNTRVLGPILDGSAEGMTLTAPPGCDDPNHQRGVCEMRAYPARPVLQALSTGLVTRNGRNNRAQLQLSGGDPADVDLVGTSARLPRFPEDGALVDLADFDRVVGVSVANERLEVWLADAGDEAFLAALKQHGVNVRGGSTVDAERAALNRQGPAGVRRFQLGVFGLGVLISAVALLLLAGVERSTRSAELAALRRQGLRAGLVRRISLVGYAVPTTVAVVAGLIAAAATAWLPVPKPAVFSDGWKVLAPPDGLSTIPFALTALAAAALLTLVLVYAARRLARQALIDGGAR